jgi:hypothetical protein
MTGALYKREGDERKERWLGGGTEEKEKGKEITCCWSKFGFINTYNFAKYLIESN